MVRRIAAGKREGLRWGDVNLKTGEVRLEDTKTGRQVRVIGRAAIELLEAAKPAKVKDEDPICPGADPASPLVGIDKARRRLFEAAKLEGVDLHSLRHTFASTGAHCQSGRFAALVSPLLGHGYTKRGITDRYITGNAAGAPTRGRRDRSGDRRATRAR